MQVKKAYQHEYTSVSLPQLPHVRWKTFNEWLQPLKCMPYKIEGGLLKELTGLRKGNQCLPGPSPCTGIVDFFANVLYEFRNKKTSMHVEQLSRWFVELPKVDT